ncbi:hypothetical protein [Pseudoxanthomonas suwonensis]|uniref:Uncharacterized protein n=1 Tax=Pseudoxanthomonas suwonensis TaxID=314722 RepID=A0A0E3UNQ0_9GAMM|nr:hypothetical protein [Pseudoxanthomonas suwonensis]AKC87140.1 hypothetical protein WQ53_10675 [Pseudoxanthomonas suwonensis]
MSYKIILDDVLGAFAAAADRPSKALVDEWTEKYPQFETEIVEFALEWAATVLVGSELLTVEEEDHLVSHTMSHLQRVSQKQDHVAAAPSPVRSAGATRDQIRRVEAAFRARGPQAAWTKSLGIDESILALFEEHMILPPVPQRLLNAFSSALNEGVDAVSAWLFQDNSRVVLARSAAKAPTRTRWTFEQAVENSTLSDEAKQQWLRETI